MNHSDYEALNAEDITIDAQKFGKERERQFIEYIVETAAHHIRPDSRGYHDVILDCLHELDKSGFDTKLQNKETQITAIAGTSVYYELEDDIATTTHVPVDKQPSVYGVSVYANDIMAAERMIIIHHDAVALTSPTLPRPWQIKLPSGIVVCDLNPDEVTR